MPTLFGPDESEREEHDMCPDCRRFTKRGDTHGCSTGDYDDPVELLEPEGQHAD